LKIISISWQDSTKTAKTSSIYAIMKVILALMQSGTSLPQAMARGLVMV